MLPEQIWDEPDRNGLRLRRPGGLGDAAGVGACGIPEAAALGV